MVTSSPLHQFLATHRAKFICKQATRSVFVSELVRNQNGNKLEGYIADKAPLFYRELPKITSSLESGFFLSTIRDTLAKLPTSQKFRESHFGEITAGIFAEDVLGLKRLYSKLSLLTSENANAFKMDLVMYDPSTDPLEFVFGEVKCSPKTSISDGYPSGHDKSCFASIFSSLNSYEKSDLNFDIVAARDRLESLPLGEQERVRKALLPYASNKIRYLALAVIDTSTKSDDEISILATRKNDRQFEVDLICIEEFPQVADAAFLTLDRFRSLCLP